MLNSVFIFIFILLLIGNFVCQIYVAVCLYAQHGAFAVINGIIRGTRTFSYGWQGANLLEIRPVMILWSFILTALTLQVCGAMFLVFAMKR